MVRVTVWLQLLLVVLILRQSASVSDHCCQLQEGISRLERDIVNIAEVNHKNKIQACICSEHLREQILKLQAISKELNKTVAVKNDLKKQLDEYKTKFQQSEVANSGLKKQLDEYETKFQQSEAVIKKQLNIKVVLKDNNKTHTQLQNTIDGLTMSLNQTIQRLYEIMENVCQDIIIAAKSGDVNTVKLLFKYSNDSCTGGRYSDTPLIFAVANGHVEVVRVLLEGGANVDRAGIYGSTPLHYAALYGRLDVCRLLLDWRAKVDPLNDGKYTPLFEAVKNGHLSVVKLLVEKGADVSVKGEDGDTALHAAAQQGHLSVVKLLVERGANVSVKSENGQTASDLARSGGHKDVADWLDSVRRG